MHSKQLDELRQLNDMIDKRVRIKCPCDSYRGAHVGRYGTIKRPGTNSIGVVLDGMRNEASSYGFFWFKMRELEVIEVTMSEPRPVDLRHDRTYPPGSMHAYAYGGDGLGMSARMLSEKLIGMDFGNLEIRTAAMLKPEMFMKSCNPESDSLHWLQKGMYEYITKDAEETQQWFKMNLEGDWNTMLRIMEIAKADEMKYVNELFMEKRLEALNADAVVVEVQKNSEKPLAVHQKQALMTKETIDAIAALEDKANSSRKEIDRAYEELQAAIELPEVNVIQVLKDAEILKNDGTGLIAADERVHW